MFLAGIVWKGTRPSFYKLSIGSVLVKAVRVGKYPHVPTRVHRYTPVLPEEPVGDIDELEVDAMKPLANRRVVIGCLEAFKMFLEIGIMSAMLTSKPSADSKSFRIESRLAKSDGGSCS
jgi:hypothetical protein